MLCCLNSLAAQTPAYLNYTVRDGLPGNLVYCGLQDRRGFLWFGTDKGLACFDGTRFRTYDVSDGLPDPEVLNIQEDSQGRLWLMCFSQKPCYILNGKIITEKEDPELTKIKFNSATYTVSEDKTGRLWFAGRSRETYFLEQGKTYLYDCREAFTGFVQLGDTLLGAGTAWIYSSTPGNDLAPVCEINVQVRTNPVLSFGASGNRLFYIFSQNWLLLEWRNGQVRRLTEMKAPAGKIYVDHKGRFWVSSTAFGAVCFDNPDKDLSNPVYYLPDQKVMTMFEDSQGTLWFGTVANGVYGLPRNAPVSYLKEAEYASNNIRSITRSPEGQIWAGDDIGNVHVLAGDKKRRITFGSTDGYNQIRQMIPFATNSILAANDEGASLYHLSTGRIERLLTDQSIKSMFVHGDKLWYGSNGRLGYYDLTAKQDHVLRPYRFTAMGIDDQQNVWAGGIGGVYSRLDSFQTNWGDQFPDLKSRIMGIRQAGKRQLWIATSGNGLLLAEVQQGTVVRVDQINKKLKKPIENIQSMFVEPNGRVWLATNRGVYGIDRRWQVVHFDTHDGLADDDVNSVYVYQDTLWAGTVSGLTQLVLRSPNDSGAFRTIIARLKYQRERKSIALYLIDSLDHGNRIELPPDASNLELELSGLDFLNRGNLKYEIVQSNLLLPVKWWTFDNLLSWIANGLQPHRDTTLEESSSLILGTFIPSGHYRIQARAIKPSGVASLYPSTCTILKKPYWYESLWFYLSLWVALGYGVWRIYRARAAYREIHTTASLLQLQALQSQMNPHFIGNTVNAIQQFLHPPDPEKTSEYIAIFMRLLRRTMDFSEQTFISFGDELTYDQEYLQLVQLRFENKFQYEITGAAEVPPDTPIPSMLLQPILENATIHGIAPAGKSILKLEFFYQPHRFCCVLTDNGIGLKAAQQQKQLFGMERKSKGLALLEKKVITLNRLYDLDLDLTIQDLTAQGLGEQGTRVLIHYDPEKIWKAINNHSAPAIIFEQ